LSGPARDCRTTRSSTGQQIDPRGAGAASARHADTPPGQADQAAAQAGKAGSPPARTASGGWAHQDTGPAWQKRRAGIKLPSRLSGGIHRAAFHGRQRPRCLPCGDIAAAHRILEHGGNTLQPAHAAPWPMTAGDPRRLAAPAQHAGRPAPVLPVSCVIV